MNSSMPLLTPALAHRLHKLSGKLVDRCRLVSGRAAAHQLAGGRRLVGQSCFLRLPVGLEEEAGSRPGPEY